MLPPTKLIRCCAATLKVCCQAYHPVVLACHAARWAGISATSHRTPLSLGQTVHVAEPTMVAAWGKFASLKLAPCIRASLCKALLPGHQPMSLTNAMPGAAGGIQPAPLLAELLGAESSMDDAAEGTGSQRAALWAVGSCLSHLKSLLADRCGCCLSTVTYSMRHICACCCSSLTIDGPRWN